MRQHDTPLLEERQVAEVAALNAISTGAGKVTCNSKNMITLLVLPLHTAP
jgi:hypothetical protein